MPESNAASQEHEPSPVVQRITSVLVDAVVVAVPTAIVALAVSERFSILDRVDGTPIFSESDQLRINEIDQGFNRAVRIGDTVFALSGSGWWLTLLTMLVLIAVVFVVLPSVLRRRSPGRLVAGLEAPSQHDGRDEPAELVSVEAALRGTGCATTTSETEAGNGAADGVETGDGGQGQRGDPIPESLTGSTMTPTGDEIDDNPDSRQPLGSTLDQLRGDTPGPAGDAALDPTAEQDHMSTQNDRDPNPVALTGEAAGGTVEPPPPVTLADADDYLDWEQSGAPRPTRSSTASGSAGAGFDNLALPESSLAELPIHASTVADKPAALNRDETAGDLPTWSDTCNAWLYWDQNSERWFRHDPAENRWRPMVSSPVS